MDAKTEEALLRAIEEWREVLEDDINPRIAELQEKLSDKIAAKVVAETQLNALIERMKKP